MLVLQQVGYKEIPKSVHLNIEEDRLPLLNFKFDFALPLWGVKALIFGQLPPPPVALTVRFEIALVKFFGYETPFAIVLVGQ